MDKVFIIMLPLLTTLMLCLTIPDRPLPAHSTAAVVRTAEYSHTSEFVGEFNGCGLYFVTVSRTDTAGIQSVVTTDLINKCTKEAP